MKENFKRVAVSVLGFALIYAIADTFLGWIFRSWMPLQVLWAVIWFAVACFMVILPIVTSVGSLEKETAAAQTMPKESTVPSQAVGVREEPAASAVIADIRAIRTPDIEACLGDSGCLWYWANSVTIDRIYVYPADAICKATEAELVVQGNRIPYIDIKVPVCGMSSRFVNKAYVESIRVARAEKDAPISVFLSTCQPDAEWTWKDVEKGLICISSREAGLNAVTGKLLAAKGDGHFYAVELFNHARKRLVPKRTKPITQPQQQEVKKFQQPVTASPAAAEETKDSSLPSAAPAPANAGEPAPFAQVNIPGTAVTASDGHSTSVSRGADYKETPVETNLSPEEEIGDAGLLRPTEDPGLTPEQLTNHAKLTWADNADTYTEYAMSAIESGETSFTVKWPEGIQTLSEATALAQYIVKDGAYPKVDVIANDEVGSDGRGKLKVFLSESDFI